MTRATIDRMCPFFLVRGVPRAIGFYGEKLGFEVRYQEPDGKPFFAIVGRDGAMLFLKAGEADPLPNSKHDPSIRWDAYLAVPDPDTLADEFAGRGVVFSVPLKDTHDGLRGFEVTDPDGYVLFFGRPRSR